MANSHCPLVFFCYQAEGRARLGALQWRFQCRSPEGREAGLRMDRERERGVARHKISLSPSSFPPDLCRKRDATAAEEGGILNARLGATVSDMSQTQSTVC